MGDFLLSGRAASRATNRVYDWANAHHGRNSRASARQDNLGSYGERGYDVNGSTYRSETEIECLDQVVTGYQTVANTAMFNETGQSNRYSELQDTPRGGQQSYTPRVTMSRSRNKYRPKRHKASECDEMLFGKPVTTDYKEWKAPWDQSKNMKPLIFDSTDRAGHYSPEKVNNNSIHQQKSANTLHKRAWR